MDETRWHPISRTQQAGFLVAVVGLVLARAFAERGFVPILDHANLLFHEAGHFFAGLLSARLEIYGGTIGQLVFPVTLGVSCWRQGQGVGFGLALVWFFENGFNIARYVGDARAMSLPLVGGGEHDWNTILARWNLLAWDAEIARGLEVGAWTGLAGAAAWVGWRAWCDRSRPGREAIRPE